MARQAAMADIANFLEEDTQAPVLPEVPEAHETTRAPELDPGTAVETPDDEREEEEEEEERASIKEMQEEAKRQEEQRAEQSTMQQRARQYGQGVADTRARVTDGISEGLQRIVSGLAAIPLPGTVLLPLSILLLFFFALLPVNGNTRLMWLWLVLSGNAHLTGETLPTIQTKTPTTPSVNTAQPGVTLLSQPVSATTGVAPVLNRPLPAIIPFGGVGEP